MKAFMLYIRNEKDAKLALSGEEHFAFIKSCENYIGRLQEKKQLVAAQPIERSGVLIRKVDNGWIEVDINQSESIQVGYYHILAADLAEAISIAKENPEFTFVPSATIEVRPIKTREEATSFVYPAGKV